MTGGEATLGERQPPAASQQGGQGVDGALLVTKVVHHGRGPHKISLPTGRLPQDVDVIDVDELDLDADPRVRPFAVNPRPGRLHDCR